MWKLFTNEVLVQIGSYKVDINLQYILLKFKANWLHGTGNLSSHARSPLDGVLIELTLNRVVFEYLYNDQRESMAFYL
jgi:hypothetical protein